MPTSITPRDLAARLAAGERLVLLDVREPRELAICALPGVVHIPMGDLAHRAGELDPDAPTVCICHHGRRSAMVAGRLERMGFGAVINLSGGMARWADDVDPAMARY